ncbi:MAG TPA: hypothetical protein PKW61_02040 [Tenuifilaceae bacterium]|nr:hypothetical protein [Tenuifilaceae bacterium]
MPKTLDKYKDYKKLYKLTKPRSPLVVEYMTDDLPDEWLISVVTYKRKSGEITDSHLILSKDMEDSLSRLKSDGYVLTEP